MSSVDIDDVFGTITEAKSMLSTSYMKPGHYLMVVRKIKLDKNRKKKIFLAIEATVLHALDDNEGQGHRVGADVSQVIMEEWDGFLGDCKAAFSAMLQCPEDDIDLAACKLVCGEDQPCEDVIVEVYCRNKTTKSDKDFTVVTYKRVIGDEEAVEVIGQEILERYGIVLDGDDDDDDDDEE